MKLLVLGGTVFLGVHLVEAAKRAGHEVTIFTRGQSNPQLFPDVEKLYGNRDGNMSALTGRRWDAVIDTSGYVPRIVRQSAELLADAVDTYVYVSSVSAYEDLSAPGADETSPVGVPEDPDTEEVGKYYGVLKAACERTIEEILPQRTLHIRPGLLVGPHDPSDRFTYWPIRLKRGGRVLAPGNPDAQVQFIDARDLAEWIIRMIEAKQRGIYNATGPELRLSMQSFLHQCKAALASEAEFVWLDHAFLLEHEVQPWIEMPLWIPPSGNTEPVAHLMAVSVRRALDAGLTFRPIEETVRDTLEWNATRPADQQRRAGLDPDKERALLAAFDRKSNGDG